MDEYQKGTYQQFRVTTSFHLGALGKDLAANSIVEFDGTSLKLDGKEHSLPSLRGAVTYGWLVPAHDNVSKYIPRQSDILLTPANKADSKDKAPVKMERVASDMDEVTTIDKVNSARAERLMQSAQKHLQGATVVEAHDELSLSLAEDDLAMETAYPSKSTDTSEVDALKAEIQRLQAKLAKAETPQAAQPKPEAPKSALTSKFPLVQDVNEEGVVSERTFTNQSKTASVESVVDPETDGPVRPKAPVRDGAMPIRFRTATNTDVKADPNALRKAEAELAAKEDAAITSRKKLAEAKVAPKPQATGDVQVAMEGDSLADILPEGVHQPSPAPDKATVVASNSDDPEKFVTILTSDGAEVAWDLSHHWNVRVKTALSRYKDDPETLKAIADVEQAGVKKAILEYVKSHATRA